MTVSKLPIAAGIVFALAILGVAIIGSQADVQATTEPVDSQLEWCYEYGGQPENRLSVAHGGMHCDLPDGTTVHLSSVTNNDYPEPQYLHGKSGATHDSTPLFGLGIWPYVFGIGLLSSGILAYQEFNS